MRPGAARLEPGELVPAMLSVAAWSALALLPEAVAMPGSCGRQGAALLLDARFLALFAALNAPGPMLLGWAAMISAMMLPLLASDIRYVAQRAGDGAGLPVLALVASYLAVWLLAVAALELAAMVLALALGPMASAPAVALAAAWQHSKLKGRACNRAHAVPVLPGSLAGQLVACVNHGGRAGGWCIVSCWALMLASMAVPWAGAMVLAALLLWFERFVHRRPLLWSDLASAWRFSRLRRARA